MQKKDQVNAAKLKQKKEEEQANKRPNLNQYQNNIEDPSNLNYKRRQEELAKYEENFNEIYETTGVKDVNEIIQKFTSQEETTKSLEDIKQEHSEKIEFHKRAHQLLKDELNKLKYMGSDNLTRQ